MNGLVVRCPQKELGCEWEGELGQVEQHLNPGAGLSSSSGCGYVMVECSFQCGAHLQRRMVGEHEIESCPKRPIEMQVASLMRKFEVITAENKILKQELIEVKQMNYDLQEELSEIKKKDGQVHEKIQTFCDELKKKQDAIRVDVDEQKLKCVSLQTHTTPLPMPPFYFAITNIGHYQRNNWGYKSEPFYSHPGGYKMAVTVFPNGLGIDRGTQLSLGVRLERGEFDDQLRWPFKGKVTVQVYNFTTEKWSNGKTIVLSEEECGIKVVQRCLDVQTHGSSKCPNFVSHSELQKKYMTTTFGVTKFRVTKVYRIF